MSAARLPECRAIVGDPTRESHRRLVWRASAIRSPDGRTSRRSRGDWRPPGDSLAVAVDSARRPHPSRPPARCRFSRSGSWNSMASRNQPSASCGVRFDLSRPAWIAGHVEQSAISAPCGKQSAPRTRSLHEPRSPSSRAASLSRRLPWSPPRADCGGRGKRSRHLLTRRLASCDPR